MVAVVTQVCSPPFSMSRVKFMNAGLLLSHDVLWTQSACNRCRYIHSLVLIGSLPLPYIHVSDTYTQQQRHDEARLR